ncbi:MOSC domain-containing protein [Ligilactobacillus salivarius]|nr:MOSC domain-containing protein [Ligilactobacillus salivarius]
MWSGGEMGGGGGGVGGGGGGEWGGGWRGWGWGDIFRWGEALIQVSQPRSPCYKLNYHFDISDIAQLMQNTGKVGWLYNRLDDKSPTKMGRRSWGKRV